jgi:hypothetical protein
LDREQSPIDTRPREPRDIQPRSAAIDNARVEIPVGHCCLVTLRRLVAIPCITSWAGSRLSDEPPMTYRDFSERLSRRHGKATRVFLATS